MCGTDGTSQLFMYYIYICKLIGVLIFGEYCIASLMPFTGKPFFVRNKEFKVFEL